jgi:transposase
LNPFLQRRLHPGLIHRAACGIFQALANDADIQYAMNDSTIVRAHQHSAGEKKARRRGNRTQPRPAEHKNPCHRRCTGNPARVRVPPGQAHDLDGADALLPGMPDPTVSAVSARGARESDPLQRAGRGVAISPKDCRKQLRDYGKHLYRARHLIKQSFNKLDQYRSIATCHNKTARTLPGALISPPQSFLPN